MSIKFYWRKNPEPPPPAKHQVSDAHRQAIINFRTRTIFWLTLTALVFLPWFTVNNFLQGRLIVGVFAVLIIAILSLQAWTIYRQKYVALLTVAGLVPAIILFLVSAIIYQGIIGPLWCYPAVLVFYFILPRLQAAVASFLLVIIIAPMSWYLLDAGTALRVTVTLLLVTIFSAIFVSIIRQQQRELEDKEIRLRESMAGASHELRTPLATLLAKVEAIKDGIRPMNNEEIASLANSVGHLSTLVNDLYLLSLSDVSSVICLCEDIQVSAIAQNALINIHEAFEKRKISVDIDLPDHHWVEADPARLRQMLDNLLENCARYTEENGTVYINSSQQGSKTIIAVEDSGPGVSSDSLNKLFQRFYREDKSRSRGFGGSGLGLPLVRALAEAQHGSVHAAHSSHGGLAVSVYLPTAISH